MAGTLAIEGANPETIISDTYLMIPWVLDPLRPLFKTKKQMQIINDKAFAH